MRPRPCLHVLCQTVLSRGGRAFFVCGRRAFSQKIPFRDPDRACDTRLEPSPRRTTPVGTTEYQRPGIAIYGTECSEFVLNAVFERRRVRLGGRTDPTVIRSRILRSRVLDRVWMIFGRRYNVYILWISRYTT